MVNEQQLACQILVIQNRKYNLTFYFYYFIQTNRLVILPFTIQYNNYKN
jgi:hypothetical protein